jgi:hypothetical protein
VIKGKAEAIFGHGTVYLTKPMPVENGVVIKLECGTPEQVGGAFKIENVLGDDSIDLVFTSKESIDVLIDKLQTAKEMLEAPIDPNALLF